MLIPKRIVQYWDGETPPVEVRKLMDSWQAIHPDFKYVRHDRPSARTLAEREGPAGFLKAFDLAWHPAMESDLVRLLDVWTYGGFYCDADHEAVGRLDQVTAPEVSLILAQRPNGIIVNGFFGSVARNPILTAAIERVTSLTLTADRTHSLWRVTGPGALRRVFYPHLGSKDVQVVPFRRLNGTLHIVHNDLAHKSRNRWQDSHGATNLEHSRGCTDG
jgi:mannosyltransferase OCH1-like enzyme